MSNNSYDPHGFFEDGPTLPTAGTPSVSDLDDGGLWVNVDGSSALAPAWNHVEVGTELTETPSADNSQLRAQTISQNQQPEDASADAMSATAQAGTKPEKYDPHGFFSDAATNEPSESLSVPAPSSSSDWVDVEGYAVTPRAFPYS